VIFSLNIDEQPSLKAIGNDITGLLVVSGFQSISASTPPSSSDNKRLGDDCHFVLRSTSIALGHPNRHDWRVRFFVHIHPAVLRVCGLAMTIHLSWGLQGVIYS